MSCAKSQPLSEELRDMTLIALFQTENVIVMAADGMGFTQGNGSHIPYETRKLHTANTNWAIGFCGWAGIEVHWRDIEAGIKNGGRSFDQNISIGGLEYLKAIRGKLEGETIPGPARAILAGFDGVEGVVLVGQFSPNRGTEPRQGMTIEFQTSPTSPIACFGSQESTGTWILRTFSERCKTTQDRVTLSCFAIWQTSRQEVTQGQLPRYAITTAILEPNRQPQIESRNPEELEADLSLRLRRLLEAYG